jgi:hypothetical protein
MGVIIKPSDLQYRYPRKKESREVPKFSGLPDPHPFDRDDLYEVIPMFEKVMDALDTTDGAVLHKIEEILNTDIPRFVDTREGIYHCLVEVMRGILGVPAR